MERIYTDSSALNNIAKAITSRENNTTPFAKKLNIRAKALWLGFIFIWLIGVKVSGQAVGDYRSNASANWGVLTTWQRLNALPNTWQTPNATQGYPGQYSGTGNVLIRNSNKVTLNVSPTNPIGSLTINQPNSNGTTSLTVGAFTLRISGNISIDASKGKPAILTISTGTITCRGNINFAGGDIADRQLTFTSDGTLELDGSFGSGGTFTANSSTVNFKGSTATQTIPNGTYNFNNVTINNTYPGGATLAAPITTSNVTGNIWVQSGTFDNAGFAITGNNLKTFEVSNGATFNVGGTTSTFPTGFGTFTLGSTSTVEYKGTGAQTIAAQNYGNLTISGSRAANNVTLANGGNIGIAGTFNPTATFTSPAGYVVTDNTISFNGNGDQTIPSFTYNNLTIPSTTPTAGIKSIADNGQVTVDGTFENNLAEEDFVIASTASGTGSLITNGSVSGRATVERYIASDGHWHLLSSPVANQDIWPQFAPLPSPDFPIGLGWNKAPTAPFWNWDFYYYNPNCPQTGLVWVNLRNNDGSYNDKLINKGDDDAGFGDAIPKMTTAKGYLVAYASGSTNHTFSGVLNSGDKPTGFPNSANVYNLIGNPYPSSLDWTSTSWSRTDLATSGSGYDYWIWNEGVGTINGNYEVFNSGSTGGTGSTTNISKYIAPAQGFWVKAAATDGLILRIPNAARAHSTQAWLKNSNSEANLIRLHLKTSGNTYSDAMVIDINPEYSGTEGSDKLWSFYAEAPEIYAIKGGYNYTIDRYKDLNTNLTINIGTKTGIAADYTITATNIQDFNLSSKVLLEDLKTGIVTDLKQTPAYTFAGAPGDEASRFRLIIGSPIGIDEPNTNGSFNIYTYENMVYVQNDKINESYFVTVSNMLGQVLVRTNFSGNSLNRIEMHSVPGVYVVNVVSNGKTYSQKVVIR